MSNMKKQLTTLSLVTSLLATSATIRAQETTSSEETSAENGSQETTEDRIDELERQIALLTEDVASLVAPTDPDLQQYLENHAGDFAVEPRLSLRHIYFSRDRRGTAAEQDARDLLQRIDATADDLDPQLLGDPLPLPAEMTGLRESEVSRYFGKVFIDGLADLEPGQWSGPVESGFGLHLVIIDERVPARAPALEEVREAVQREWLSQRRQEAVDGLYDRLAENYTIEIESLLDIPATEGQ